MQSLEESSLQTGQLEYQSGFNLQTYAACREEGQGGEEGGH